MSVDKIVIVIIAKLNMDFPLLIDQLHNQILHFKSLQNHIGTAQSQISRFRKQIHTAKIQSTQFIQEQFRKYQFYQNQIVIQVCRYYEREAMRERKFYQNEIDDLREEISRQYKEVEDLMQLVTHRQVASNSYSDFIGNPPLERRGRQEEEEAESVQPNQWIGGRYFTEQELQVIQEEETERTFLSSARSLPQDNTSYKRQLPSYIRIEEKAIEQLENLSQFSCELSEKDQNISQIESNQNLSSKRMEDSSLIENSQVKLVNSKTKEHAESIDFFSSDIPPHFYEPKLPLPNLNASSKTGSLSGRFFENKKDFFKIATQQCQTDKHNEGNFLTDLTNIDAKQMNSKEKEKEPKTKQFLQEFRKTFNKCLSSIHASKKHSHKYQANCYQNKATNQSLQIPLEKSSNDLDHSMKIKNTTLSIPNQAMFSKDARERRVVKDKQNQGKEQRKNSQNQKLINSMLKDLENSHRFIVGCKKLELRYEGEKIEEKRHGHGLLYYANGICYEGEFKDQMRHGYGILRFNHVVIYNGAWQDDELSGEGKIRNCAIINKQKSSFNQSPLSKWVSYCGAFKHSRFEGEGTLQLQGGEKFLGKFICGEACGEGTFYKKNGQSDTAIWRNNQIIQKF